MQPSEEKEDEEMQPSEERKKKGQKLWLKSDNGSHHVVLFTKMPLSYELWKLKTVKMCF